MAKYIYNLTLLQFGDIILARYPGDDISKRVMDSTHSEYSHAMLYVGGSSYIEADKRVQARNLARCLFDNQTDTCLLRIKEEYLSLFTLEAAVYYARFVVGNPYAFMDALRLEDGRTENYTFDTQICTRLVAKAYEFSGLKIVGNVNMCTPQELLESKYVDVHRDFLKKASPFDIRVANSYDVTDDMVKATELLFDSIKSLDNGKIRSLNALTEYVIKHPDDDAFVAEMTEKSGYLNVLDVEEEKNVYNYDKNEFIKFYKEKAIDAAIASIEENRFGLNRYVQDYKELVKLYISTRISSHYLIQMISLYKRIIEQHNRRIKICNEVISTLISFQKRP